MVGGTARPVRPSAPHARRLPAAGWSAPSRSAAPGTRPSPPPGDAEGPWVTRPDPPGFSEAWTPLATSPEASHSPSLGFPTIAPAARGYGRGRVVGGHVERRPGHCCASGLRTGRRGRASASEAPRSPSRRPPVFSAPRWLGPPTRLISGTPRLWQCVSGLGTPRSLPVAAPPAHTDRALSLESLTHVHPVFTLIVTGHAPATHRHGPGTRYVPRTVLGAGWPRGSGRDQLAVMAHTVWGTASERRQGSGPCACVFAGGAGGGGTGREEAPEAPGVIRGRGVGPDSLMLRGPHKSSLGT